MKHYNQALQHHLALEANLTPIGSACIFPSEFLQCGLVVIPKKNEQLTYVCFVYANCVDNFSKTESKLIGMN